MSLAKVSLHGFMNTAFPQGLVSATATGRASLEIAKEVVILRNSYGMRSEVPAQLRGPKILKTATARIIFSLYEYILDFLIYIYI